MSSQRITREIAERLAESIQLCHSTYCVASKIDSALSEIDEKASIHSLEERRQLFRDILRDALASLNSAWAARNLPSPEDILREIKKPHFRRLRGFEDIIVEELENAHTKLTGASSRQPSSAKRSGGAHIPGSSSKAEEKEQGSGDAGEDEKGEPEALTSPGSGVRATVATAPARFALADSAILVPVIGPVAQVEETKRDETLTSLMLLSAALGGFGLLTILYTILASIVF